MGFLGFGSGPSYVGPQISTDPGDTWQNEVSNWDTNANQSTGAIGAQINRGVDSESNLMGPQSSSDPESSALAARGSQLYGSAINKTMRQGAGPLALQRQQGLQSQDLNNQSAIFSNEQSRQAINYNQAAFARTAAIQSATIQSQLYSQLFGGLAIGGGYAAAGGFNARNPAPAEAGMGTPYGQASQMETPQDWANYAGAPGASAEGDWASYSGAPE